MKAHIANQNETIISCLDKINNLEKKILFIVDENNCLKGSITDGDLRRAFLNKVKLSDKISYAMNKSPIFIREGSLDIDSIQSKQLYSSLTMLPIINKKNQIIYVVDLDKEKDREIFSFRKKGNVGLKYALLMAGGQGKRMLPLTKNMPKPMLEINNKPILEWQIEYLKSYGIKEIFISVNYKSEIIKNYFLDGSKFNVKIEYIEENKKLGTAGPISMLKDKIKKDILVLNGDTLTNFDLSQFYLFHKEKKSLLSVGGLVHTTSIPYGVIENNGEHIINIIEKPSHSYLCNAGIYLLNIKAVAFVPDHTEYNMDTLIKELLQGKNKVCVMPVIEELTDIGNLKQLEEARSKIKN